MKTADQWSVWLKGNFPEMSLFERNLIIDFANMEETKTATAKEQRVIKFRAFTEDHVMIESPCFFEVNFQSDSPRPFRCYDDWRALEDGRSVPCEIMQFTGLTDKEGKEIYEDDLYRLDSFIYRVVWSKNEAGFIGVIVGRYMHDGSYSSIATNEFRSIYGNLVTVIGNIHQNPELL